MAKLIYFTAGVEPTDIERLEIDRLNEMNTPAYEILVRNGAGDNTFDSGIEDCDKVAGTIPTAYNGVSDYGEVHDDRSLLFVVWPAVVSFSHLATFQLYPIAVNGTNTFDLAATDVESTTTWGTSDAAKATVSSGGLVTGVAAGTCTITATHTYASGKTETATRLVTLT